MSNLSSSSIRNHSKKLSSSRDRDKNKSVASESGGSSQCETPPLTEKDGVQSLGRFAGIGPDSVQCISEQISVDISTEAAINLAEDVSYKLRQTISTIALYSEMLKQSCVNSQDVNTVLMLSDTSPVIGSCTPQYMSIAEENIVCQVENLINVAELAMTPQSYVLTTPPSTSVEWIIDEKNLNTSSNINANLQNYYTKVARAILCLKQKFKETAVEDLATNTRIGPIFPNLFNLAVLVLNDDNLNALNVPAKKPLQSSVLDMVDALCSNPCSLDTNIQQQFQRLFPVMVSNILGNGSLSDKMVDILTKITRTWPSFISIGKGILFDYLSQGTKERLTSPMIKCVLALGRGALVECLGDHLDYLEECMSSPAQTRLQPDLREAILDASTCLLKSEPTTFLEDYVMTEYTLYEMLGDSIAPRRTLFPRSDRETDETANGEKTADEEHSSYTPLRPILRRPKVRLIPANLRRYRIPRESVFEPTNFRTNRHIHIKIKSCRAKELPVRMMRPVWDRNRSSVFTSNRVNSVVAASGLLNRFRYRLRQSSGFPIFGALTL